MILPMAPYAVNIYLIHMLNKMIFEADIRSFSNGFVWTDYKK
ncbi:hypothetical protein [Sporosarcina sp. A2]